MPAKNADAYLAALSADKRATLEKLRATIRAAAPAAEEGMSYGMPAFIQGKPIAGYQAAAKFCSYYPMSGRVIETLKADLAKYEVTKGAIHFPIGKPLPLPLVRKLVKARLAEIGAAAPKTSARPNQTSADVVAYLRDLKHPLKKEIEAVERIVHATDARAAEAARSLKAHWRARGPTMLIGAASALLAFQLVRGGRRVRRRGAIGRASGSWPGVVEQVLRIGGPRLMTFVSALVAGLVAKKSGGTGKKGKGR